MPRSGFRDQRGADRLERADVLAVVGAALLLVDRPALRLAPEGAPGLQPRPARRSPRRNRRGSARRAALAGSTVRRAVERPRPVLAVLLRQDRAASRPAARPCSGNGKLTSPCESPAALATSVSVVRDRAAAWRSSRSSPRSAARAGTARLAFRDGGPRAWLGDHVHAASSGPIRSAASLSWKRGKMKAVPRVASYCILIDNSVKINQSVLQDARDGPDIPPPGCRRRGASRRRATHDRRREPAVSPVERPVPPGGQSACRSGYPRPSATGATTARSTSTTARAARVWDIDGNDYVDYRLGYGPAILGYADDRVDAAARAGMEVGGVFALSTERELAVADRIAKMVPVGRAGALLQQRHRGGDGGAAPRPRLHGPRRLRARRGQLPRPLRRGDVDGRTWTNGTRGGATRRRCPIRSGIPQTLEQPRPPHADERRRSGSRTCSAGTATASPPC